MSLGGFKLVSGGQTGVDRAALDWAIANGIPHGGWCPQGRKAEDGVIDGRYELKETPSTSYLERTEWNVRDSDAIVIICINSALSGGSQKTLELAREHGKPFLILSRAASDKKAGVLLHRFIQEHQVRVLNVAGPRESEEPEAGTFARLVLNDWHHLLLKAEP